MVVEIYWPYTWPLLFWFLEIPEIQIQNFLLYYKKPQRDLDNMCFGYKQKKPHIVKSTHLNVLTEAY